MNDHWILVNSFLPAMGYVYPGAPLLFYFPTSTAFFFYFFCRKILRSVKFLSKPIPIKFFLMFVCGEVIVLPSIRYTSLNTRQTVIIFLNNIWGGGGVTESQNLKNQKLFTCNKTFFTLSASKTIVTTRRLF